MLLLTSHGEDTTKRTDIKASVHLVNLSKPTNLKKRLPLSKKLEIDERNLYDEKGPYDLHLLYLELQKLNVAV